MSKYKCLCGFMISSVTFDPDSSWTGHQGFCSHFLGLNPLGMCCSKANLKHPGSILLFHPQVQNNKDFFLVIHIFFLSRDAEHTFLVVLSFCLQVVIAFFIYFCF